MITYFGGKVKVREHGYMLVVCDHTEEECSKIMVQECSYVEGEHGYITDEHHYMTK